MKYENIEEIVYIIQRTLILLVLIGGTYVLYLATKTEHELVNYTTALLIIIMAELFNINITIKNKK